MAFCTAAAAAAVAMAHGSVEAGVLARTRSSTSRLLGVRAWWWWGANGGSSSPSMGGGVTVVIRRSAVLGVDAPWPPENRVAKMCCAAFGLTGCGLKANSPFGPPFARLRMTSLHWEVSTGRSSNMCASTPGPVSSFSESPASSVALPSK